jgi:hypothetical protein
MSDDELRRISEASDWREYYDAYSNIYHQLLERTWALGYATLVGQLHHSAIPDASGSTCGLVNWAIYSQPSTPTLEAFLKVFNELLTAQPFRVRSSRFIFFAEQEPAPRDTVNRILFDVARKIDFYCDSLKSALSVPSKCGALDSINVLASTETPIVKRTVLSELEQSPNVENLKRLSDSIAAKSLDQVSSIPPSLWKALVDSSFILTAFRFRISATDAEAFCTERGGIGAYLALERARDSNWGAECLSYCNAILQSCPPRAVSYKVEPGDMLSRIVRRNYRLSFDRLWPIIKVLNPTITDPNRIVAGRELKLPILDAL